jgi:hypothetical protein
MSASHPANAVPFAGRSLLFLALAAYAAAVVIHNRFGLDPAIAPAALLTALTAWRPRRPLLWGAAFFIAAPSFLFLEWSALTASGDPWTFANHLALLAAGLLAVASAIRSLRPTGARHRSS